MLLLKLFEDCLMRKSFDILKIFSTKHYFLVDVKMYDPKVLSSYSEPLMRKFHVIKGIRFKV